MVFSYTGLQLLIHNLKFKNLQKPVYFLWHWFLLHNKCKGRDCPQGSFFFPQIRCQSSEARVQTSLWRTKATIRDQMWRPFGCDICHPVIPGSVWNDSAYLGGSWGLSGPVPCSQKEETHSFPKGYRDLALILYYVKIILWMPAHSILRAVLVAVSACKWEGR